MSEKEKLIKELFTNPDALEIMYLLASDGQADFKTKELKGEKK